MFKLIANTAAVLSLASSTVEACGRGHKKASKGGQSEVAISDIKKYTGDSLLNSPSEKHNEMKSFVRKNFDGITTSFYKGKGIISGFLSGFVEGFTNNLLQAGFSILTLSSKRKSIKTIGMVGLALSTAWDFLKNGTNLFTKKDYIEK